MSPSSRAGAESTEDAEQKSGLPYIEGPRLVCAGRFTCLAPLPRMGTQFLIHNLNPSTFRGGGRSWNRRIGWSVALVPCWSADCQAVCS